MSRIIISFVYSSKSRATIPVFNTHCLRTLLAKEDAVGAGDEDMRLLMMKLAVDLSELQRH
jgi:hypothetical protein